MRVKLIFLLFFIFVLFGLQAFGEKVVPSSESEKIKKETPNRSVPQKIDLRYPVSIVYSGQDSIGMRLVLEMKEYLMKSKIFRLSTKDEKKIKIFLNTKDEFPARPGLGSVYSVVWCYSPSEDVLSTYLDSCVGVINFNQIKSTAEVIISKTDEVISQFSYLFER